MNRSESPFYIFGLIVIVAGVIAIVTLQDRLDSLGAKGEFNGDMFWVPDWRMPHALGLGDDAAAADVLWIRSVFYMASAGFETKQLARAGLTHTHDDSKIVDEEDSRDTRNLTGSLELKETNIADEQIEQGDDTKEFSEFDFRQNKAMDNLIYWNIASDDAEYMYHLFNVVTTLDERFITPYYQGSMYLALMAGRYEEALELLNRGMQKRSDRWEMPYFAGFIELFFRNNKPAAADYIQQAALKPDAPIIIVQLAASLQVGIGRREMALKYLRTIYETTEDLRLKEKIEDMLMVYGQMLEGERGVPKQNYGTKLDSVLTEI